MTALISLPTSIYQLHDASILRWKTSAVTLHQTDFLALVEENHSFNYQLWHTEDEARRDDKGHTYVYQAKRAIDGYNQQRNNRMEAMDSWLFQTLKPSDAPSCPVHSETPGMIIDRLSILALKLHSMYLQTQRKDVESVHLQTCQSKHNTLTAQRQQLVDCLQQLLQEVAHKTRTFRVYHQFKMYNDPALNPALYCAK